MRQQAAGFTLAAASRREVTGQPDSAGDTMIITVASQ
jgi:hypothetical protein